jgi:multiple sugar transport system permease protein
VNPGRTQSEFIDQANTDAGLITVDGSWRRLDRVWELAPEWGNYAKVWDLIDYPRLLFNTIALATIGTIGTLLSCTLVAYGFARFRFPGRQVLFTLLIATIFLPAAVTLIPTYTIFLRLGWVGTWLPLLVPAFLANAYDVFLLRQYFLTIPRDLDEAAAIDGAGPLRTLWSVVLPQAWPAIIAVGIFTFVYTWNDFFGPLIYLSAKPELQPIAVGLAQFNGIHYRSPALIQAGTVMTLVVPVILFIIFQRFFTRGIVISGVEK